MAKHEVRLTAEISNPIDIDVLHKDVQVEVKADGKRFGTLTISKGGVGWTGKGKQLERVLNWQEFDSFIRNYIDEN